MIYRSPYPDVDIPNITLQDYLFEHAAKYADKAALIDGPSGRTLTYGQLVGTVQRTAAGLAARGFGKGDVFAIYSPNVPEYAIAFFGVATAGEGLTVWAIDDLAQAAIRLLPVAGHPYGLHRADYSSTDSSPGDRPWRLVAISPDGVTSRVVSIEAPAQG